MTEEEWLAEPGTISMLTFLRERVSDRKLRLVGCAYCRDVWPLLGKASRRAVTLGEELADQPVDEGHQESVIRAAIQAVLRFEEMRSERAFAADMAYRVLPNDGWYAVEWTIGNWWRPCGEIIREIFGNPFRSVAFDPAWRTSDVLLLARGIYEERAFDRMPILADALQDAGCDSDELLGHLRDVNATHVRGCWALDLVLEKE